MTTVSPKWCLTPQEKTIFLISLTNNPTFVDTVSVVPGISDHETVIAVVKLRPTIQKMKPRTVRIYSKANWEGMRHDMLEFQSSFLSTCEGKNTEQLQYTKRGFTIFHVGFGVVTLCLAQSRWFHGDGHREFQVNQRDSQRDEERGVIIDFREMGCFIATPCLFVSGREILCLYVSEREIYDLLFTFAISAHGSKVQLTAYAQKPS